MYSQLPFTLCLVLLAASQCSDFDYCHPLCVRGWKCAVGSCVPTHKSAIADSASGAIGHRDQAGRAPGPASKRACPASSHIPLDSACPVSFVLIASRWSSASTPALLAAVPGSRSTRHLGCVFNAIRTRISGDEVGHAIAYELLSYECECARPVSSE